MSGKAYVVINRTADFIDEIDGVFDSRDKAIEYIKKEILKYGYELNESFLIRPYSVDERRYFTKRIWGAIPDPDDLFESHIYEDIHGTSHDVVFPYCINIYDLETGKQIYEDQE